MPSSKRAKRSPKPATPAQAADAQFQHGLAYLRAGRRDPAQASFAAAVKADANHAESLHMLGVMAYEGGRPLEAIELIAQAVRLAPQESNYAVNLGNALNMAGRPDDAELLYRGAAQINPQNVEAFNNLGALLRDRGRPQEAKVALEAAIAVNPGFSHAYNNLGATLNDLGEFEAAAASFQTALRLNPDQRDSRGNLGNTLAHLGRLDEAIDQFRLALAAQPNHDELHHNLAMTLLRAGQFEEGWREYEWRWRSHNFAAIRRSFAQPQWDGSPLGERVLLVHAEQGFGDTLQFCRYVSRIEGRVILEAPAPLVRLLDASPGIGPIIAHGAPLPHFDVHCPMMSLPGLLEGAPDPLAHAEPYLVADPQRAATWTARLTDLPGLKVGLVWAGGARPDQPMLGSVNRRRSMSLAALAPLAAVPGVSLVSLQKGGPAGELAQAPPGMTVHDFTAELHDFSDTAALIAALDLVISVDTAVAHLAGGLGKPVWLMNRFDSCWRWMAERRDSPWYPTLTQFRQPAPGDWEGVVAELAQALSARAAD